MTYLVQDMQSAVLIAGLVIAGVLLFLGFRADAAAGRRRRFEMRLSRCCGRELGEPRSDGEPLREALSGVGRIFRPILGTLTAGVFSREADREKMRRLLSTAGYRDESALGLLGGAKLALAALLGFGGWWVAFHAGLVGERFELRLVVTVGGVIAGLIAPEMFVRSRASARRESMRSALPDAIDLMVIAAYAGQSLDMALDRVAREMPPFSPPLAEELGIVTAEMQVKPDRAEALRLFADRVEIKEVNAFTLTLGQTIRYGAPFADSLKALAADLRQARMLRAEERGAKLPALLTLPLILFIMPSVFVVMIGPALLSMSQLFAL